MSYSIYDNFLTVQACNYYAKQIADKLNLKIHTYYYDNLDEVQIPGDDIHDICSWLGLDSIPLWRRTFNLCNAKKIKKIGIDNYVLSNHELNFYLTVKGKSIIYAIRFFENKVKALDTGVLNNQDVDSNNISDYLIEHDGQLRLNL